MDLPSWRAFLVSLSSEADPAKEMFHGRVEHVQTGRRAAFSSPAELEAFMALALDDEVEQQEAGHDAPWRPDSS